MPRTKHIEPDGKILYKELSYDLINAAIQVIILSVPDLQKGFMRKLLVSNLKHEISSLNGRSQ
jgi:hypothetical protein